MTARSTHFTGVKNPSTRLIQAVLVTLLCSSTAPGQKPPITDIAFAPNGDSIACCSQTGMQILDWPNLNLVKQVDVSFPNLHCVTFSPDGEKLAVAGGYPSEEGIVQIFSWPDCVMQTQYSGHDDSVVALNWQGRSQLISASLDRTLKRWNLTTRKPVLTYHGHSRGLRSVRTLRTGELVTAGNDHSVRVWQSETGSMIRTLNQHTKPISAISVCPISTGRPMIATAAGDRTIRFWQPTIGRMMRYVRLESEPLDICWIHENLLAASCEDGRLRIIDTEHVKVLKSIPALTGWAYAIAAHPTDGTLAIAGSNGQILRVHVPR